MLDRKRTADQVDSFVRIEQRVIQIGKVLLRLGPAIGNPRYTLTPLGHAFEEFLRLQARTIKHAIILKEITHHRSNRGVQLRRVFFRKRSVNYNHSQSIIPERLGENGVDEWHGSRSGVYHCQIACRLPPYSMRIS